MIRYMLQYELIFTMLLTVVSQDIGATVLQFEIWSILKNTISKKLLDFRFTN